MGDKDLKRGRAHNKKNRHIYFGKWGVRGPSCSPWQEDKAGWKAHTFIGRSHMREQLDWGAWLAHGKKGVKLGLCCWSGISCFVSMGMDAGVGSKVEQRARPAPRMSCSACLLGQSRGCSSPYPRVMGQVLVSAPPGYNSVSSAIFGSWLRISLKPPSQRGEGTRIKETVIIYLTPNIHLTFCLCEHKYFEHKCN